jgi:preprotein translocase subunit SecF
MSQQALKIDKIIPFMGHRWIAAVLSTLLILISIGSLSVKQLNLGLDFTGGTLVEVGYDESADLEQIRGILEGAGYRNAVVVNFGSDADVLIRLQQNHTAQLGDELLGLLREEGHQLTLRRIEFVGPQIGEELKEQGGLALLIALAAIMIYVAFRFQFKFSVGAVVALMHDVIITLGMFSLFQWEFDLTVLAALLAVIGYSLNDTIVVSDRIRENFRLIRDTPAGEIIDISLTQTLGRTLMTSITTVLVLLALFVFGGEMIHGFAQALLIGVVVGTYSSVYVAANVLMMMHLSKEDLLVVEKEGEEIDELP